MLAKNQIVCSVLYALGKEMQHEPQLWALYKFWFKYLDEAPRGDSVQNSLAIFPLRRYETLVGAGKIL